MPASDGAAGLETPVSSLTYTVRPSSWIERICAESDDNSKITGSVPSSNLAGIRRRAIVTALNGKARAIILSIAPGCVDHIHEVVMSRYTASQHAPAGACRDPADHRKYDRGGCQQPTGVQAFYDGQAGKAISTSTGNLLSEGVKTGKKIKKTQRLADAASVGACTKEGTKEKRQVSPAVCQAGKGLLAGNCCHPRRQTGFVARSGILVHHALLHALVQN